MIEWSCTNRGDYSKVTAHDARTNVTVSRMVGGVQWIVDPRDKTELLLNACASLEAAVFEAGKVLQ